MTPPPQEVLGVKGGSRREHLKLPQEWQGRLHRGLTPELHPKGGGEVRHLLEKRKGHLGQGTVRAETQKGRLVTPRWGGGELVG